MTVVELLTKAREIQAARGLNRGWFVAPKTGEVCMVAALRCAMTGSPMDIPLRGSADYARFMVAYGLLNEVTGNKSVPWFNDKDATGLDAALAAFDRAIALASAEAKS